MYPVSEAYKQAIQLHRTHGVRNRSYVNIYFGQFDASAKNDASLSSSAGTPFSSLPSILAGGTFDAYAAFEQDFFRLDGALRFLPEGSAYLDQGYASDAISGPDGTFSTPPTIAVDFSEQHSMVGLTILFDSLNGVYAEEFTVTTYLSDTLVETHTVANAAAKCESELYLEAHDRIVISFAKLNRPGQRLRVQQLLFGIGYVYNDDAVMSLDLARSISQIGLELPQNTLSFELFNEGGKFDIDGENSLTDFLKNDQKVQAAVGYDLVGDGSQIEWVQLGQFWLDTWSVDGIRAQFSCSDAIARLSRKDYEIDTYAYKTAQELIAGVMADAGYSNYDNSPWELSGYVQNPLPIGSHAECLQLIANYAMCTLEVDPSGKILFRSRIKPDPSNALLFPDGGTLPLSVPSNLLSTDAVLDYATLEPNFFRLDGSMRFIPESAEYINAGVVFDAFPNADGVYRINGVQPTAFFSFDGNVSFGSIRLDFGGSHPDQVRIWGLRDIGDGEKETVVDKYYPISANITTITGNFDRIIWLYVIITRSSRNQRARLQRASFTWDTGFELTEQDIIGNAKGEILTACKDAVVDISNLQAADASEISKQTIPAGDWVRIKHDAASEVTAACAAAGVTVACTPYARATDVKVTGVAGDVEVVLTGKKLSNAFGAARRQQISVGGEDCEIENPLISDQSIKTGYLPWVSDYLGARNEWQVNALGYPEVQPGDQILFKGTPAYVKSADLSFSGGGLREKFVLRKREVD